ncbi:hypothetical protein EST38_g11467 [Candolleomyces aberdarensis]|uniref:RNA helicase n=1 Tax=Candolleomyces aberdarensis TaxID=2316362 RepID=A0A4Q2D734_9AGAR|nr:hypothetical protein EST38_g11467 [Candolleomyces aberdarensis]
MPICQNVLTSGTCSVPACPLDHVIFSCDTCNFFTPNQSGLDVHLRSKRHRVTAEGRNQTYHCSLCDVNVVGSCWEGHVQGAKHRKRATTQGVDPAIEPLRGVTNSTQEYCSVCKYALPHEAWSRHVSGFKHLRKEAFLRYRTALDEAEKDKNNLTIEGPTNLGFLEPSVAASGFTGEFVIKSSEPFGKTVLSEVSLVSNQGTGRRLVSGFSVHSATLRTLITSRSPITVIFKFTQRYIGRYDDRIEFIFEDTLLRKKFVISRQLQVVIGSEADHAVLRPVAPYVPRERKARTPETTVVPGIAPSATNAIPYVVKLPRAPIPKHLLDLLSGSKPLREQIADVQRLYITGPLSTRTYARRFKHLLWIEEHRTESDLERYDMSDVTLSRHNQFYFLGIPGLAEKRPSVLVGDRMLVQRQGIGASGHWYEGHVHVVRQNEVGLVFHSSFGGWTASQKYNVRFKLNRIVLRRQHQALDSAFEEERVLFPTQAHVEDVAITRRILFINSLIAGNPRQREAVQTIVHQQPGSPPFVVFGPPGTGKTVTIVEAIRQILRTHPTARILACAPSNSAADLIAERLSAGLTPNELFRMYAPSRSKSQIPDTLNQDYTYTSADGHFSVPLMARLKSFRVVVATCVASSMLSGVGMPRGHYSHIFIDEAGQATEPEAFISIKTLADPRTNVVLSGDPKQLGPIIRSSIARTLGLETSYLERLMAREVYDETAGHGKTVVKLTQNFRSHSAILKFPNDQFYSGDLEQCAPSSSINTYLSSPFLANPKFPVVFHSVLGKDDREASSPSFFNIDEALVVKSYVQQLKETRDRRFRTNDNDIGIIAPYHAQCLKLRTTLRSVADGIKVGSVEEFQGQERKVIMISTVRSSKDFVDYDLRHTLGFVANPRRFNVAVTRAKALLIVIGNPHVLSLDPLWRSFLNYIYLNDGWVGPDIPWDPQAPVDQQGGYDANVRSAAEVDMNEYTRRMEELVGAASGEQEGQEGMDVDANVDRPWRDVE